MRALRFSSVAILSVLIASSVVLYAQDEKQQDRPAQQAEPNRQGEPKRQDEARPESKQDEMKAPRQDEAKPSKQDQEQKQLEDNESRGDMRPGHQEGTPQQGHARGEKSAHIPDDKFHAQFGRSHTFVVQRPVVVEGGPGFFYGGYSFVFVDPWPSDWDYADDCYVDYIDGEYFLFDLRHPGMRIAVMVVM